jgi:hypothetical protein
MYFAALLFNLTLAIAVTVSLLTSPDEEFRVSWVRLGLAKRTVLGLALLSKKHCTYFPTKIILKLSE